MFSWGKAVRIKRIVREREKKYCTKANCNAKTAKILFEYGFKFATIFDEVVWRVVQMSQKCSWSMNGKKPYLKKYFNDDNP
jgi:hypothetical protein